jgi:hypothetical protein
LLGSQIQLFELARRLPVLNEQADRYLVQKLRKQLEMYGDAEFSSHAESYRPVPLRAAS